jgi:hypothetical protein
VLADVLGGIGEEGGGRVRFEKTAAAGLIINGKIEMAVKMQLLTNSLTLKINSPARGQDSVFVDIFGGIWEGEADLRRQRRQG